MGEALARSWAQGWGGRAGGPGEGGRTQAGGLGSLGFGGVWLLLFVSSLSGPASLFSSLSFIGSLPSPGPASCVVSVVFSNAPSLGTMIATSQQVFVVRTR